MKLEKFGIETRLHTTIGGMRAVYLNPSNLSSEDRKHLFNKVYPVALDAFGQQHSEKFAHDVWVHVLEHKNLFVIQDGDRCVAFAAWDFLEKGNKTVVYLAGICVMKDYQRHIAGRSILIHITELADQKRSGWTHFALRTQNWAMQRCIEEIANTGLYQKFGDTLIDLDLQCIGSFIAEQINDLYFDPNKLVSRGIYGTCLYGTNTDLAFYPGLNSASGDAAYCLWQR